MINKKGFFVLIILVFVVSCAATSQHAKDASTSSSVSNFTDSVTGMEFILVKGGCFQMGDTFGDGSIDEKPVHDVCVDDFYIGKYEVTRGQWKAIMGNNPFTFLTVSSCGDRCPVERVSWNDIQVFILKMSQQTGKPYRLPTEAEWEYAARSGGRDEEWSGTNNQSELGEYAWYSGNSGHRTHPVGQKKPNGLGIFDMTGNVSEWVQDWYDEKYYQNSPKDNPQGPPFSRKGERVLRGTSWNYDARESRNAHRYGDYPTYAGDTRGFRLVVSVVRSGIIHRGCSAPLYHLGGIADIGRMKEI